MGSTARRQRGGPVDPPAQRLEPLQHRRRGHHPGFLRLVRRFVPEARVTVLAASYPEELRAHLQKFPEQLGEIGLLPMEFKAGEPLSPAMEQAFAGADLLVLNSGMTLSYGYYGHAWERILPRLLAFLKARELGVPYGVYGHSFDRIDPRRTSSTGMSWGAPPVRIHPRLGVAGPAAREGRRLPGDGVRAGQHLRLRPAGWGHRRLRRPLPLAARAGGREGSWPSCPGWTSIASATTAGSWCTRPSRAS